MSFSAKAPVAPDGQLEAKIASLEAQCREARPHFVCGMHSLHMRLKNVLLTYLLII